MLPCCLVLGIFILINLQADLWNFFHDWKLDGAVVFKSVKDKKL